VIPEPDKVIQVCTAQALRAGIFHDEEPSDPPHLTHVRSRREWMATEFRGGLSR
jgi:hypothetical protein